MLDVVSFLIIISLSGSSGRLGNFRLGPMKLIRKLAPLAVLMLHAATVASMLLLMEY